MKYIYLFFGTVLTITPMLVNAQEFNNFLVGIPGVTQGEAGSFDDYIQAVYVMFISVAALLAVVKIIIAGLKYMFTDIVPQKGQAKKDIQGALLGLLIVLSAVLILTVINPELTNFNLDTNQVALQDAQPVAGPAVTVTPNTDELGYTYVSNDLSAEQRINFIVGCGGRVVIISDQVRCYEVEQEVVEDVIEDLDGISDDDIQTTLNLIRDFVGDRFISDENIISGIIAEQQISDVLFAVEMPVSGVGDGINGFPLGYETQVESICNTYAEANPQQEVGLIISYTGNYAVCAVD